MHAGETPELNFNKEVDAELWLHVPAIMSHVDSAEVNVQRLSD